MLIIEGEDVTSITEQGVVVPAVDVVITSDLIDSIGSSGSTVALVKGMLMRRMPVLSKVAKILLSSIFSDPLPMVISKKGKNDEQNLD